MLVLFLQEVGALREDAELLAVGAGHEAVLFWLANQVGRIVATDIYGEGDFARGEAQSSMLKDPSTFAPHPYERDRLDVRWMDARDLRFPDGSFDAVFSLASIEHFGGPADIAQAAAEIGRVVRPGGHAFVATELFVPGIRSTLRSSRPDCGYRRSAAVLPPPLRVGECWMSSPPRELRSRLVIPRGAAAHARSRSVPPPETFESITRWGAVGPIDRGTPHILPKAQGDPWTSICLALEKSSS